jgi:thiol-disulfide isomerase/thioredoxin
MAKQVDDRAAGTPPKPFMSETALPVEGHLPGFDGATGWLNSEPLGDDALRGKVVLVDFWTYTCINWLRTLGYVRAWAEKYAGQGLVVVSVHTPEFWFEHDVENVRAAVKDLGVEFPVALDEDYGIWRAFANRYWPAVYIADGEGRIRHHQFGEGGYEECERIIQQLLRASGSEDVPDDLVSVADEGVEAQADWSTLGTPETYLGSNQAQNFARDARDQLDLNHWSLSGEWSVEPHASVLNAPDGQIRFRFHARDVNLVLRAQQPPVPFRASIDGQPPGDAHGLDVDELGRGALVEPRLYQLIRQPGGIEDRTFEITFDAPGVEAYSFTFG